MSKFDNEDLIPLKRMIEHSRPERLHEVSQHWTNVQKELEQAITDLLSGFTKLGVATSQTDGQWYVDPVRTFVDLGGTMLSGLKGNDLFELGRLGR